MNNLLKTMTLSVLTSTLLFSADSFVDTVGFNLGKAYTDHSIKNSSGAIILPHEPDKNYNTIELFTTLKAINKEEDIKPYISYTYSKNTDMEHQYLLVGVNKYFKNDTLDYYAGVVGGYGQIEWQYNPINNSKNNKTDAHSFILGLQAGLDYPLSSKLNLGINAKYLLHNYETQFEPSSGVSATLSHERTIFIGLGLSYKIW